MPSDQDDKFAPIILPDISKADPTKITKFSKEGSSWRTVSRGLNLEGCCKNKQCKAYGEKVWTMLKFGTFHMSETVYKCKCPECSQPTKGNKKIGIYKTQLTGRGMKKIDRPQTADLVTTCGDDTDDDEGQNSEVQVQIEFPKIVVNDDDGFLKFDGQNGEFVKWRYMTLEIKKIQKIQKAS